MKLFGRTLWSFSKIEVRLRENLIEVLKDIWVADELRYEELSSLSSNARAIAGSLREDFTNYLDSGPSTQRKGPELFAPSVSFDLDDLGRYGAVCCSGVSVTGKGKIVVCLAVVPANYSKLKPNRNGVMGFEVDLE
jgi:hypothetical protein